MSVSEHTGQARRARHNLVSRVFLEHPASVNESFLEHLRFAFGFSGKLFQAAGAALIHALIPCLFEKTASTIIRDLVKRMDNRG